MSDKVTVELTHDEALVLFDLLSRRSDDGQFGDFAGGESEVAALEAMTCALESVMAEPFRHDYAEALGAARQRLAPGRGL